MTPQPAPTRRIQNNSYQADDAYAWLTHGSPFPLPRVRSSGKSNNIELPSVTWHLRLLIILGVLSTLLFVYVSFELGRQNGLRARQQDINRYQR